MLLTPVVEYPNIRLDEKCPVVNVGTIDRPSYLPAEVCVVLPGQVIKRRLSPAQTQAMIQFACRKPWENGDSIVGDGKGTLGLNPPTNPFLVSLLLDDSSIEKLTSVRGQWAFRSVVA